MTVRQCLEMHLNSFKILLHDSDSDDMVDFYSGALFATKLIFEDLELFVPKGVLDVYKQIDD